MPSAHKNASRYFVKSQGCSRPDKQLACTYLKPLNYMCPTGGLGPAQEGPQGQALVVRHKSRPGKAHTTILAALAGIWVSGHPPTFLAFAQGRTQTMPSFPWTGELRPDLVGPRRLVSDLHTPLPVMHRWMQEKGLLNELRGSGWHECCHTIFHFMRTDSERCYRTSGACKHTAARVR